MDIGKAAERILKLAVSRNSFLNFHPVTRLSMYFRSNARLAELFPHLDALSRNKNLGIDNANNPETKKGMSKIAKSALKIAGAATAGWYTGWKVGKSMR